MFIYRYSFLYRIVRTDWLINETISTGLSDREKKKLFASSDRQLLELAQVSIKTNQIYRLKDLACWASNEKTVELLVQLAKHHKLVAVVEDIEAIRSKLFKATVTSCAPANNPVVTIPSSSACWSTPKLPDSVSKESPSPSGILANLTPIKPPNPNSNLNLEIQVASSPSELISSPSILQSNPFAKNNENLNPAVVQEKDGSAILDYISAMMKMNGNATGAAVKRKGEDNLSSSNAKKNLSNTNANTQ